MKHFTALAVCLSLASAASAAGRVEGEPLGSNHVTSSTGLSAELYLSEDGNRAMARLADCREDVRDWPRQCKNEVTFALTALTVDAANRTITHDGQVVARWSRFGRFVRLEPAFRLGYEVAQSEEAVGADRRTTRRATLFLSRLEAN